jgi:hypothetical protein
VGALWAGMQLHQGCCWDLELLRSNGGFDTPTNSRRRHPPSASLVHYWPLARGLAGCLASRSGAGLHGAAVLIRRALRSGVWEPDIFHHQGKEERGFLGCGGCFLYSGVVQCGSAVLLVGGAVVLAGAGCVRGQVPHVVCCWTCLCKLYTICALLRPVVLRIAGRVVLQAACTV